MPPIHHQVPWFLGIIGNMGPEADEMMQQHIRQAMVRNGAQTDQDHIPMLVLKNPHIPDRTAAILYNSPTPIPQMMACVQLLNQLNVPYAIMPCNTAHYFLPPLQAQSPHTVILNMLQLTAKHIDDCPLLLATNGTIEAKIYQPYFEYVVPPEPWQNTHVHAAIYGAQGLKAGNKTDSVQKLQQVITHMQQKQNFTTVVLACTELPLVQPQLQQFFPQLRFIDPMVCAAQHIVGLYRAAMPVR